MGWLDGAVHIYVVVCVSICIENKNSDVHMLRMQITSGKYAHFEVTIYKRLGSRDMSVSGKTRLQSEIRHFQSQRVGIFSMADTSWAS